MKNRKIKKPKNWIADALSGGKNKGALRRTAMRKGLLRNEKENLSMTDLKKLEKVGGKTAKRASLAKTLRKFKAGGQVKPNIEIILTENRPNGAKWRGVVKPFMLKSIENNQYKGGFLRYDIDIYDDKIEREPTKEEINQVNDFFEKVGGRYEKGGSVNTGASWHLDRQKRNKSEDWELPMYKRKKKYAVGGHVSKGQYVWNNKMTSSDKMEFLYENFTPQITPRGQELLVGKSYKFLPRNVKIKLESKYADVEFSNGGEINDYLIENYPAPSDLNDDEYFDMIYDVRKKFNLDFDKGNEVIEAYVNSFSNGGSVEYKKRIKKFGFKPYGKKTGKYTVSYIADGEQQKEVWDTEEMALSTAKRYIKIPNFSGVKVMDGKGNNVKFSSGGVVGENSKIKDWYIKEYSSDDLGQELNDESTFKDLLIAISNGDDVYSVLGVADSIIRERAFAKLSKINNKPDQWAYNTWLSYSTYSNGGSVNKPMRYGKELHQYNIGDKVSTRFGVGVIVDYQVSIVDSKQIPSYWILFDETVYPDLQPRNIWESSIIKKHYEVGEFELSAEEKQRLEFLQKKEDTDSLNKYENREYEQLVKKYRKTKDYRFFKKKKGGSVKESFNDKFYIILDNGEKEFYSVNKEFEVPNVYFLSDDSWLGKGSPTVHRDNALRPLYKANGELADKYPDFAGKSDSDFKKEEKYYNGGSLADVGDRVKVVTGANKGLTGKVSSIEKDFTGVTVKTDSGHILYGFSRSDLQKLNKQ